MIPFEAPRARFLVRLWSLGIVEMNHPLGGLVWLRS